MELLGQMAQQTKSIFLGWKNPSQKLNFVVVKLAPPIFGYFTLALLDYVFEASCEDRQLLCDTRVNYKLLAK